MTDPTYKQDMCRIGVLVVILLIMFVSVATATPVSTWSGAGPNACHGQCDQEWAESQLTPSELEELNSLRSSQPNPQAIEIRDGDVFRLATYFKDGQAVAYRTTTVAVLPEPTGAMGWHMDGWSWVKLDACSNWTLVEHQGIHPGATPVNERVVSQSITTSSSRIINNPSTPSTSYTWDTPDPWTPTTTTVVITPTPEMPAVPLSPTLVFSVLALGSLFLIRRISV